MACSLVKSVFFVYCVIQSTADHAPRRYLYARMRLRLWLLKGEWLIGLRQQLPPSRSYFAGTQSSFKVWGKMHFRRHYLCFVICFRQIFLDTTKFGRGTNSMGGLPPNAPPRGQLGAWSFERKWLSLLQGWSILHCRFNSLVRFD